MTFETVFYGHQFLLGDFKEFRTHEMPVFSAIFRCQSHIMVGFHCWAAGCGLRAGKHDLNLSKRVNLGRLSAQDYEKDAPSRAIEWYYKIADKRQNYHLFSGPRQIQ